MATPFKMKGHTLPGINQKTPLKYDDGAKNLLKAVPNEDAYNKLSDLDKKGFDKAGAKAGLPTKKTPPKSPAKIAPLVLMGAQMLASKMMEKKKEE